MNVYILKVFQTLYSAKHVKKVTGQGLLKIFLQMRALCSKD